MRGECMGYSTNLYAVDLHALRAVVGSRDARLLKRLRPAKGAPKAGKKDPLQGPRVKLTRKGAIVLNGQAVTFDQLRTELNRRKWKGTYLFSYVEATPRTGRWRNPGSFSRALARACPHTQFLGTLECNGDEDLNHGWKDDEISAEEAAAELVEGTVSQPGAAHQYGYGLERLCRLLGTRLATIEGKGGMLSALELETPLARKRAPVRLPKREEFPDVGYLTADEVRRELERLRGRDPSQPRSAGIEEGRKTFFRCLKQAAEKRVGIVAFYY